MSRTKEWVLKSCSDNKKSLIDRLLEVRGIKSEDAKQEFLRPLEITLMHPNAFCDMPKAVERIVKAIDEKENILIYGDFDADGVTSTSVLLKTFKHLSFCEHFSQFDLIISSQTIVFALFISKFPLTSFLKFLSIS